MSWNDNGGWWNMANSVEILTNFLDYSDIMDDAWMDAIYNVTNLYAYPVDTLVHPYYDDVQWWSLAMLRIYEYTLKYNVTNHDGNYYLNKAIKYFDYVWNNSWDNITCDGGFWWSYQKSYKNAITNELGLMNSIKIYSLTNNSEYLNRFNKIWYWFYKYNNSGIYMINNKWLINDGLNVNKANINICNNNNGLTWTYNQGVILGSLSKAYLITNNDTFIQIAWNIIQSVIHNLNTNNILSEPANYESVINSPDATQFKGIFIRYLCYFYDDIFIKSKYNNNTIQNTIQNYITFQIDSLINNCQNPLCLDQFGDVWYINFTENADGAWGTSAIAQSNAIDLLNFAWKITV